MTFILSLHGGGSSGTWQRRYFPAFEQKEKHRLVIAAPYSPTRRWSEKDDAYLQNIVTMHRRRDRAQQRAGLLARRPLAGRHDVAPHRVHRLLQDQGRRVSEPVGRPPRRRARASPGRRTAAPGDRDRRSAAAAAAPAAGRAAGRADLRLLTHLRDRRARDRVAAGDVHVGAEVSPAARAPSATTSSTQAGATCTTAAARILASKQWGLLPRPGTAEVFVYPELPRGPSRGRRDASRQGPHRRTRAARDRGTREADAQRACRTD